MKLKYFLLLFLPLAVSMPLLSGCSGDEKKAIRLNSILAPFSGTDIKGKNFSLALYKNKPVLVRFFLVDCNYCIADTPIFNNFYEKRHKSGLEIVYINNDAANIGEVENFADTLDIHFPVIYDPKGSIAKKYNVRIQPLTFVLSPEHKILAALLGGVSEGELDELLAPYLQE